MTLYLGINPCKLEAPHGVLGIESGSVPYPRYCLSGSSVLVYNIMVVVMSNDLGLPGDGILPQQAEALLLFILLIEIFLEE